MKPALVISNQQSAISNQPNRFTAKDAKDAMEEKFGAQSLCDLCARCG